MSGSVKSYIDGRLSTVYKYKNSVQTYENLPTENVEVGDVYNVVDAHGTIGEADYTPAGTNYAWNGSTWDALGGSIDLSNYVTEDELNGAIASANTIGTGLNDLSGSVIDIETDLANNYANRAEVVSADVATLASASAIALTVSGDVKNHLESTYWTSGKTEQEIMNAVASASSVGTGLNDLSGSVIDLKNDLANNYANRTEVVSADVATLASASAISLTVSGNIKTHLDATYWTSGKTEQEIMNAVASASSVGSDLNDLSGSVVTLEPKVNSALQGFELTGDSATTEGTQSTQSGAKANYTTGGTATLDLSELIIDCGDW